MIIGLILIVKYDKIANNRRNTPFHYQTSLRELEASFAPGS